MPNISHRVDLEVELLFGLEVMIYKIIHFKGGTIKVGAFHSQSLLDKGQFQYCGVCTLFAFQRRLYCKIFLTPSVQSDC
jgi:hypothetical protein